MLVEEKRITNGERELIYEKRILVTGEKDSVKIELALEGTFPLVLEFLFKNTDDKKPAYDLNSEEIKKGGFHYTFTLKNFNNSLGTGTINPIGLMTKQENGKEKTISLGFLVYKVGESNRALDVSLYEEA